MAMESSLRDLAKGYASGQLEKAKYRTDRTAFIEGVLSGTVTIRKNPALGAQQAALSAESRVKNTSDKTTLMGSGTSPAYKNTGSSAENSSSPGKTGLMLGIGAAVAALIIVTVVFLMSGGGQEQQTIATGNQSANNNNPPQTTTPSSVATNLVRSFLGTNSWSQASIDNFLAEWSTITDSEKNGLTNSIELGQLTNAIYKKLLEERALSGIGNPETSYEKQRVLVEFATRVGINDPRIALPEQTAPTSIP